VIDIASLARRAVACKGWRWMPGMLNHKGARLHSLKENGDECFGWADCHEWHGDDGAWGVNKCEHHSGRPIAATHQGYVWLDQCLPDLTDPATLGCLLALVREAWGDSKTCARPDLEDDVWYVVTRSGLAFAASEAEALVAALESAP
jgi:hypothetical protein